MGPPHEVLVLRDYKVHVDHEAEDYYIDIPADSPYFTDQGDESLGTVLSLLARHHLHPALEDDDAWEVLADGTCRWHLVSVAPERQC